MENNNPNNIITNTPIKGLVTDLLDLYQSKEIWTYCLNGVTNTSKGDGLSLSNEPSNIHCVDLPYTYIGNIPLINQRFAIFTTDNTSSEIGIFDSTNCTYSKVVNDPCLGFNTSYLISGKSKVNFDCTETIYFTDSALNPLRKLNLTNIPYVVSGYTSNCQPIYTSELDCNELKIYPNIKTPIIDLELSPTGTLSNGTYQIGVAYSVNKHRLTDIFSITNPISVWDNRNYSSKGIIANLSNLDYKEFDQIEILVAYSINNAVYYKSLGFENISTDKFIYHLTSVDRPEFITLESSEFRIRKVIYEKADWCTGNDKYLLFQNLQTKPDINYQLQAFNITSKYVVCQAPVDYYGKHGGVNKGHYRDEVYAYEIEWQWDDDSYTSAFHIPGTATIPTVSSKSDNDYYEKTVTLDCHSEVPQDWFVYNTASISGTTSITSDYCDLKVVGEGTMAYWQSTEIYPNNLEMFGSNACQPIRHHKFPDEAKVPRYINNGQTIQILGVAFQNIEHPKDLNGNYIEDIKGYRILRADRFGNKSVISRGVITNMGSYQELDNPTTQNPIKTIYYPNYPYNDLRQDPFLADRQVLMNGAHNLEDTLGNSFSDAWRLHTFSNSIFTYYSPHCQIGHIALGTDLIIETEESGAVPGQFVTPYLHPRDKILSLGAATFAGIEGLAKYIADNYPEAMGKGYSETLAEIVATPSGVGGITGINYYQDIYTPRVTVMALKLVGVPMGVFMNADNFLDLVRKGSNWEQYAVQYNSSCFFNVQTPKGVGNKRRLITNYQYLFGGLNTFGNAIINNFNRPSGVMVELNQSISTPTATDTSRFLLGDGSIWDRFSTQASLHYVTNKLKIENQYGQLDSLRLLNTGYFVTDLPTPTGTTIVYDTQVIFGGDCFINKYSFNNKFQFFRNILSNLPDGFTFDYRSYRNVGFPIYWDNSTPLSFQEIIGTGISSLISNIITYAANVLSGSGNSTTLAQSPGLVLNRYSLDRASDEDNINIIRKAHFYTSCNGAIEFIAESDYNLDYRSWDESKPADFSTQNPDLEYLFRSDRVDTSELYTYDHTFSKQNNEITSLQQPLDFNKELNDTCYKYHNNRVIYSLPANQQLKNDNWLYFLANNYYDFPQNSFGNLISTHPIDNQQLIFFFDKSAPYTTIGRDQLQTTGDVKITIGDGGLFSREPRPLEFTEYGLGSNFSRYAFTTTEFGNFFPSFKQGKVFVSDAKQIKSISDKVNKYWHQQYMPLNATIIDNPTLGVGYISGYDIKNETYFLTKRDKFNEKDCSWTMSYKASEGYYIGWHDWHPIAYLNNTENMFTIFDDSKIYKHNATTSSFCNFYGVDYPFAFELPVNSQQNVELLNTIEYQSVGLTYDNNLNTTTFLDKTFNKVIIRNDEQISGELNLTQPQRNNILSFLKSSTYNPVSNQFDIQINKVENKFRLNDFFDITKDRGETSNTPSSLFNFDESGYKFTLNQSAIDYNKSQFEKKRFRHKYTKVYFELTNSSIYKLIFDLSNFKTTFSSR